MSSHNSVTFSPESERPVARLNLDILDSRAAWYWTMARHSRGAARAIYSARAELASAQWDRLREAAQ